MSPRFHLGLVIVLVAGPCFGTQTITTTYQHNGDGALTAVTTQVDARPAVTTYLTWDNFTPDAAAPASGTVRAADGNLVGLGASPGLTGQLTYDVRDRLTACSPAGQSAASYAYHPNSLMASSTLASGDALQFYYDNAATPLMINTRQFSTGLVESFLGPVRYLSDGSEQVLLTPRKDTAAVYDAAAQSLSPYSYDPYGAPSALSDVSTSARPHVSTSDQYDLTENPFQYAAEYRDPTCSTYYLRARWYLPAQQTFLSRDPADGLHRYSYTAGNPVGRSDPSGLKFTGTDFSRDVDKLVGKLAPGIWAYVEPLLPIWGQALGGVELVGTLPSFWHHPTAAGFVNFGFLAASMAAETGAATRSFDRLLLYSGLSFKARLVFDVGLGASQTAAQADRNGRLDVPALIQGIDTTVAGIFWARFAGGIGHRPFSMSADDAAAVINTRFGDTAAEEILVFRVRYPQGDERFAYTNPLLERVHAGRYYEQTLAVGREWAIINRLRETAPEVQVVMTRQGWSQTVGQIEQLSDGGEYGYVGRVAASKENLRLLSDSPLGYATLSSELPMLRRWQNQPLHMVAEEPDTTFGRNCQRHAAAVRQTLGF